MKKVQRTQTLHLKRDVVRKLESIELERVVGGEEAIMQDTKDVTCPWTNALQVTGNN